MAENNNNNNKKTASKKTTKRTVRVERVDVIKLCAFWGIFLAAVLFVARGILGFFDLGSVGSTIMSVFDLLGKLALLVAVAFPAYGYVRGKAKVWKIIYWVALIVYILGCVFSVINF